MDLMGVLCFQLLQLMSPLAQGLFHRAISQSGTAIMKVFITPDPLKAAKVGTTLCQGSTTGEKGWRHSCIPILSTEGCSCGWLQPQQHKDHGRMPEGSIGERDDARFQEDGR